MGVIYTPPRRPIPWAGRPFWAAFLFRPGTIYRTRKGLIWEAVSGEFGMDWEQRKVSPDVPLGRTSSDASTGADRG